uniref:Bestrophin homolog n=1 Tax=Globodera pallida TaxID=36090 RepID=A0A183C7K1_GLOPA
MTCFVMKEYEKMIKMSQNIPKQITAEDTHFFPQHWLCAFQRANFTLIKYKNLNNTDEHQHFVDQFMNAMAQSPKIGNESLTFIRSQMYLRMAHATSGSMAYRFVKERIINSPFLMEFIVRMFFWDFKVLGFPIPTIN